MQGLSKLIHLGWRKRSVVPMGGIRIHTHVDVAKTEAVGMFDACVGGHFFLY